MCTEKEKTTLHHLNRTLIAVAGAAGLLMDGFQAGDTLCTLSMLFWLWQAECKLLEEKWLDGFKRFKARKVTAH